ncbi:MAG TPA: ATP-binding protein [Polyangiaceae bacterium]|nr:ATP-binding protein [Polyangiaceae bacterium]
MTNHDLDSDPDAGSRERSAAELRKLNAFLDSIIDNIPAMVFVKDADNLRYELFNRAGEAMSGFKREQIYGKSSRDLFPIEQADFFNGKDRAVLRDGRMLDIPEEPINTPLGKRWLHTKKIPIFRADGTPSHLLGISLDITERKVAQDALAEAHRELERRVEARTRELSEANLRLQREIDERKRTQEALAHAEEQLRQAQKLEAVGRLAGGVAHDFNNLLSVILCCASLMEREDSPVPPAQAAEEITRASERAAVLTRQLLAFSRQQMLAPRVLDLNEVVLGTGDLLERVIGEDVELSIVPQAELWRARMDVSQLEQVLMNLVVNARDAMPSGGKLVIETRNAEFESDASSNPGGVGPGCWVVLSVRDTGIGMDEATAARAFEPFYTTKPQGRGTGLGLSTAYGIVKQSAGHILLETEVGRGTRFDIYLPRTLDSVSSRDADEASRAPALGNETLLLVEDDDQVRSVAHEILKLQGYRVIPAGTPAEALELSAGFPEAIHLLLTDVVMPAMNGRELAQSLLNQRPELHVLYMSGYADQALNSDDALTSATFLQKPLTPDSLAHAVRRVLDAPR